MEQITVVIPNYNGMKFLKPCLDALGRQTMTDFETIVVDDGSTDESVAFLQRAYPRVHVLPLEENGGFCKAANAGVRAARSEYVILLNNDTVPETRFVEALYQGIRERPDAFSCSACMLCADDPTILDGAGDLYNILGWAYARGKGKKAVSYDKPVKVFSSCGGAAVYRRNVFLELGLLDENHISYLEDLDIGYRARIHGYENWYLPDARVIHVGSGTTGGRYNKYKVEISARNNIYVIHKNMPLPQFLFNSPFLLAGFLMKYLFFCRKGFGKEYMAGIKEGFALNRERGTERKQKWTRERSPRFFRIQLQLWKNLFRML